MPNNFKISVNDGIEKEIIVLTGQYISAASAVPAILGIYEFPVKIKIWMQYLLPDYPGHTFIIERPGGEAKLYFDNK